MMKTLVAVALSLGLGAAGLALAGEDSAPRQKPVFHAYKYAPPHLSPEWRAFYDSFQPFWDVPDPHDLDGWREWDRSKQALFIDKGKAIVEQYGAGMWGLSMNGVRVVEITPREVSAADKSLMYMHGGAWSSFTPESTLTELPSELSKLG